MKKTLAKILALALCAILLVTGTVFVTLAYLMTKTDVVTNTFTSANVYLRLDEAKTNAAGEPVDENGDKADLANAHRITTGGNEYHLVPGSTYTKDPTVTVTYGDDNNTIKSEPCYVFIAVYNTMFPKANTIEEDNNDNLTIAAQMTANGWTPLNGASLTDSAALATLTNNATAPDGDITIYYIKASSSTDTIANKGVTTEGVVIMTNGEIVLPIFESFTIDSAATGILTTDKVLNIIAFAVQSAGMDTAEKAWTSTYGQSKDLA